MARWLVKSEPDVYSIDDLARDGTTRWDGVRNHAAKGHLARMREGDLVFLYHSNADPSAIVGIAKVAREGYPDPSVADPKHPMYDAKRRGQAWVAVDLAFHARLPRPVTLAEVKAEPKLAKMSLVRISQLSVQPVTVPEWDAVLKLARGKPRA